MTGPSVAPSTSPSQAPSVSPSQATDAGRYSRLLRGYHALTRLLWMPQMGEVLAAHGHRPNIRVELYDPPLQFSWRPEPADAQR